VAGGGVERVARALDVAQDGDLAQVGADGPGGDARDLGLGVEQGGKALAQLGGGGQRRGGGGERDAGPVLAGSGTRGQSCRSAPLFSSR